MYQDMLHYFSNYCSCEHDDVRAEATYNAEGSRSVPCSAVPLPSAPSAPLNPGPSLAPPLSPTIPGPHSVPPLPSHLLICPPRDCSSITVPSPTARICQSCCTMCRAGLPATSPNMQFEMFTDAHIYRCTCTDKQTHSTSVYTVLKQTDLCNIPVLTIVTDTHLYCG